MKRSFFILFCLCLPFVTSIFPGEIYSVDNDMSTNKFYYDLSQEMESEPLQQNGLRLQDLSQTTIDSVQLLKNIILKSTNSVDFAFNSDFRNFCTAIICTTENTERKSSCCSESCSCREEQHGCCHEQTDKCHESSECDPCNNHDECCCQCCDRCEHSCEGGYLSGSGIGIGGGVGATGIGFDGGTGGIGSTGTGGTGVDGGNNNDVNGITDIPFTIDQTTDIVIVPEPSTYITLGIGLVIALFIARKRARAAKSYTDSKK